MGEKVERRQEWHRIIGINRRGAPIDSLEGRPLPDPTLLLDEDFQTAAWAEESRSAPSPAEDQVLNR